MRKNRFDRLLAGTALALIVAAPTFAGAAPDRVESVVPLPPSLNGQTPRHREAASVPAPETPPAAAAPQNSDSGFIGGTLDRLVGASDAQMFDPSMAYGSSCESIIHDGSGRGVNATRTATNPIAMSAPRTNPNAPPISRSSQESPVHLKSFERSFPTSAPAMLNAASTVRNPSRLQTATEWMCR